MIYDKHFELYILYFKKDENDSYFFHTVNFVVCLLDY